MTAGRSNLVDIDCRLLRESDSGLAWLLDDGARREWVPKSQVQLDPEAPDLTHGAVEVTATMPESLAAEKGFDSSAQPGQGRLL